MNFTDLGLTIFGGAGVLARTARRFGLFELLEEAVSVKVRDRGASDAETLWAMIASLARGHGALSEPVLRHRAKQGRENAFKGPLRDMDPHHPPCRSYRANQAFYALGQINCT